MAKQLQLHGRIWLWDYFLPRRNVKGQRWLVVETLETYIDGEGEVGAVILATI